MGSGLGEEPSVSENDLSSDTAVGGHQMPQKTMHQIMSDVRTSRSRKSNRSTYVEAQSIFGSAMESLFGKNSIFSALEDPQSEDSSL